MKKKILALVLGVLTAVGCVLPVCAAQTAALSVSAGTVQAGESVELTVSIQNNPGIAAALLYIYYNASAFTVDIDHDLKAAGDFKSDGAVLCNSLADAKKSDSYTGSADADGALVLWYNGSGSDTRADGEMLKIRLTAQKSAANGSYTVALGYSPQDTCSSTGAKVALQTAKGTIQITGGSDTQQPVSTPTQTPEFSDISGHWAEQRIRQAASLGLVEGYQGKYRPDDTMTRAEFVTILWRAQGEPVPKGKSTFRDLTQDWYRDAVAWAEENQVVNGMGEGVFAPDASVTREQLVTILHRLAGTPTGTESLLTRAYDSRYPDSGQVGSWAKPALYWAIYSGIYCGENAESVGTELAPKANATRAQIAVMMVNYLNRAEESEETT